ncbi:3-deoxy-D-manno-octulosonic acid transferase [Alphaproteobacteria bacterium]|nr:3-deoxy-D-manno-octulosonic acid transferase [Alphaproteobacteria bacterium]
MNKLYRTLFQLLSPLLRVYFYSRCFYGKDRIGSVCNHFGKATIPRPAGKLIWVHAASVGESTAALTFINHIKKKFTDLNVLITTITVTSFDILKPKIEKISNCHHQYAVADNPRWIKRFMDHWKVDVAVFLESEIWPNTMEELEKRKIPTFLLSARLSPKSFKRWCMVREFFSKVVGKFDAILAQSSLDEERFRHFSPENTKLIDNLKYANALLPCNDKLLEVFQKLCKNKRVLVAASTHEKEEEAIIEAHIKLKKEFDIVTIIIPRHLTRVKRVCETIQKYGLSFSLRTVVAPQAFTNSNSTSQIQSAHDETDGKAISAGAASTEAENARVADTYCIDSFGEVGTFFRIADVCFVGGSLVPIGGHNIYEPVAIGKPVLHGPFMDNALEIRDFLHSHDVAFEVHDANEIYDVCYRLLSDANLLKKFSETAQKITKNESLAKIDEIMQLEKIL